MEIAKEGERLHERRSTRARILQNDLLATTDLALSECLQGNELRRLGTAADGVGTKVGYRVLEVARGTSVLGLKHFFRVEEIDERGYRQKGEKKDENDSLLHLSGF